MQIQRTPHGFDCRAATTLRSAPLADGPRAWLRPWSCAKIECLASDEKKGWVYLGVTTPRDSIEIYKSAPTVSAPCIWNGNTAPAVLDALHLQQMRKSPDARRLGILPSPCYQGC